MNIASSAGLLTSSARRNRTIVRFGYFKPKEVVSTNQDEFGFDVVTTVTVKTTFMFVVTTLFTLPAMIALFLLVEFEVPKASVFLRRNFHFLEHFSGKGDRGLLDFHR